MRATIFLFAERHPECGSVLIPHSRNLQTLLIPHNRLHSLLALAITLIFHNRNCGLWFIVSGSTEIQPMSLRRRARCARHRNCGVWFVVSGSPGWYPTCDDLLARPVSDAGTPNDVRLVSAAINIVVLRPSSSNSGAPANLLWQL